MARISVENTSSAVSLENLEQFLPELDSAGHKKALFCSCTGL
jgi:hypothetical protein